VTWGCFALAVLILLALGALTAAATSYRLYIPLEHRLLARLEGSENWLACFSKIPTPGIYEECVSDRATGRHSHVCMELRSTGV
jgi:hypothetical protein